MTGRGRTFFVFDFLGGGGGEGFVGKKVNAEVRGLTLVTRVTR